jgi:hypothetical protein
MATLKRVEREAMWNSGLFSSFPEDHFQKHRCVVELVLYPTSTTLSKLLRRQ